MSKFVFSKKNLSQFPNELYCIVSVDPDAKTDEGGLLIGSEYSLSDAKREVERIQKDYDNRQVKNKLLIIKYPKGNKNFSRNPAPGGEIVWGETSAVNITGTESIDLSNDGNYTWDSDSGRYVREFSGMTVALMKNPPSSTVPSEHEYLLALIVDGDIDDFLAYSEGSNMTGTWINAGSSATGTVTITAAD